MKIGTKSLLFGCHQFVLHPIYTYVAWRKLYNEFPSIGETVAIIIHDWGYWGKSNLDGEEGERHPEWADNFFRCLCSIYVKTSMKYLPTKYYSNDYYLQINDLSKLCLYHSRFYAKKFEQEPSKLCWADKRGTILYGKYLWLFLATITGELKEYMTNDKYEIYYKGVDKDKWFTEYVKFITPIIQENAEKFNNKTKGEIK